jgi:hypothetical protein
MMNSDILDFTNSNLLDSNIVGKATANSRRRHGRRRGRNERYSNAVDPEMVNAGVQATVGLASALASRKPNEAKQASRASKKDMKNVCGRRPLLKKKREGWDKCVAEYMKTKQPTTTPAESSESYKTSSPSQESSSKTKSDEEPKKKFLGMPQTTGIIVTVLGVAVIGFFGYKMFFANKGAAAAPAPAVG